MLQSNPDEVPSINTAVENAKTYAVQYLHHNREVTFALFMSSIYGTSCQDYILLEKLFYEDGYAALTIGKLVPRGTEILHKKL